MLTDLLEKSKKIEAEGVFLGGPPNAFTRVGRNQLITLLDAGITPDSTLLDIGCGCLRGGYWLIHFLDKSNYFGIEPNKNMLDAGLRNLFNEDELLLKSPSFSHNENFDLSVFNRQFDFMVARSIFSHAAPNQILTMLDSFSSNSTSEGVFLASFVEAEDNGSQYSGITWVGKSHKDATPGIVKYKYEWFAEECRKRKLRVFEMYEDYGQKWLKIFKHGQLQTLINREPRPGKILSKQ